MALAWFSHQDTNDVRFEPHASTVPRLPIYTFILFFILLHTFIRPSHNETLLYSVQGGPKTAPLYKVNFALIRRSVILIHLVFRRSFEVKTGNMEKLNEHLRSDNLDILSILCITPFLCSAVSQVETPRNDMKTDSFIRILS